MSTELVFQAAGGLALFLLAMQMMTDGLKAFAGQQLRTLLGSWTRTPLRGVGAGVLITGLVQSSSAVTVATIGFVNAGLLSLQRALGVIFGANVGTTMTGWLVSLVGFGFKIENFALPILAIGVGLRLVANRQRWQSLGDALAGFGLFFLGLALLQAAFSGITGDLEADTLFAEHYGWPMFIAMGFVATLMTQSSSAALAIILTAAAGNLLALDAAAAAVIGANLGTTSTAAFAVLKATASAKRLAIGHILFNAITGLIALAILPAMLWFIARLADWLDLEPGPVVFLAMFHTLFNVLGVVVMLPLTRVLARQLERLFHSAEEDNARPRYLDNTLVKTPELAVAALGQEMKRLHNLVEGLLRAVLNREGLKPEHIRGPVEAIRQLGNAITLFVGKVRGEKLSPELVAQLTASIRSVRYYEEAAIQAEDLLTLRNQGSSPKLAEVASDLTAYFDTLRAAQEPDADYTAINVRAEEVYQLLKSALLTMVVEQKLSVDDADIVLDALSGSRRLKDQWLKACTRFPLS
ncbi:Na/Pi cotransporter family protein [Marinobacter changyiensis]|uniref:Na/Pi cotransporter family protein n=1 Tax=Marinobacter changyiensis TaxID=2604091 RepID=UPI0012657635|nr:Na/Pi symporter [Marinobacter changyiensis]